MAKNEGGVIHGVKDLLNHDYRGVNIAVYALATAGLAIAVHKIRPVSKFSAASKVPDHFVKQHEPLRGEFAGVQHSPVRILVNHKAPVYLPFWHSSKPPLPVKLWGVDVVSSNAVNWLECVAKGKPVTLKPISKENNELISTILLHLQETRTKNVETIDIGKTLVELGFAKAVVPKMIEKNTVESSLAPVLLSAETRAKTFRNGIWSDQLPPLPNYVIYWRKGSQLAKEMLVVIIKKILLLIVYMSRSALVGAKNLALRPFRASPKQIQAAT